MGKPAGRISEVGSRRKVEVSFQSTQGRLLDALVKDKHEEVATAFGHTVRPVSDYYAVTTMNLILWPGQQLAPGSRLSLRGITYRFLERVSVRVFGRVVSGRCSDPIEFLTPALETVLQIVEALKSSPLKNLSWRQRKAACRLVPQQPELTLLSLTASSMELYDTQ
jgi:hypothetical protein